MILIGNVNIYIKVNILLLFDKDYYFYPLYNKYK